MIMRLSKVVMCLCLASFAFLVTFNNITDYGSNYNFVMHVMSMDTTFPGNALMYRSITSPTLWAVAYWAIIFAEGVTCVLFLFAALRLWQARNLSGAEFDAAKWTVALAAMVGFLVWFFGFMVVGGQWFAMWQSPNWNGQEAAFKFYVTIMAVLIYVNQRDRDLA